MPKFRKKPIVIEAERVETLLHIMHSHRLAAVWEQLPDWFKDALAAGGVVVLDRSIMVKTREGDMPGEIADWIIHGVKGELYPCKPDVFAITYEPV